MSVLLSDSVGLLSCRVLGIFVTCIPGDLFG